jgi:flagellar basal-body rod protein FlgG
MNQTGNQLDVAIQGRGYLQVLMPSGGVALDTRAGNLSSTIKGSW